MDGIYQVRGYDMANLTLIRGDTGWIIFDPLMSVECTQAAMALVEKNLGRYPVKAIIISHPHIDHYGGIKGLMRAEDAADASQSLEEQPTGGKIPILVPEGFTEHAVSENVYAGIAMGRRAGYQYGIYLEDSVTGSMAMGIGMGQSVGLVSFDYMGIVLNKQAMADRDFSMNFTLTDTGEQFVIRIVSGVLLQFEGDFDAETEVFVSTSKNGLMLLLQGNMEAFQSIAKIEGDVNLLEKFAGNMTELTLGTPASFHIVEP